MPISNKIKIAALAMVFPLLADAAPSIDANLSQTFANNPLALAPVMITYQQAPSSVDIAYLQSLGLTGGVVMNELPMIQTVVNQAQFSALSQQTNITSLYGNTIYDLMMAESVPFIGADAARDDQDLRIENGGLPVSGDGIGVAYIDTGIDATHPDLMLGQSVQQNVFFPLAEVPLSPPSGFLPPIFIEDVLISDVEGGHGTFGAGNTAGTGAASAGLYDGVAPGAELVGLVAGNDAGLSTFAIVQAYDYALANQQRYNIRVANNSFGSALGDPNGYDPSDPINVATRMMHDSNIAVVFAAGNDGEGPAQINRLSVAPWVISVAAGEKRGLGTPAGFSSRGVDNGTGTDTPGFPADPNATPNLRPDITAPGVDINSTRSKGPGVTNLAGTALGQDLDIAPAFLPFYTTSQGTSFASPHVAGVIALMLQVNPDLNPDEIVTILRATSTPMPFEERVVGSGYVDAHNAVRFAAGLGEVPHPANLFQEAGTITDVGGDQTGTQAQDILSGSFDYDSAADQLVYTMTLADLSDLLPNTRYVQSSAFAGITVFVSSVVLETGGVTYGYGTIAPDPDTGVNTQTNIGDAASGAIEGNNVVVRLDIQQINDAVGFDVRGTSSTAPEADTQITIGTSITGGLLLNADNAAGADFIIGEDAGDDDTGSGDTGGGDTGGGDTGNTGGENTAATCGSNGKFTDRYADAVTPNSSSIEIPFSFSSGCDDLNAKLTYHPGNQTVSIELINSAGAVLATGEQGNSRQFTVTNLTAGDYRYRVTGIGLSKGVDFAIKSTHSAAD